MKKLIHLSVLLALLLTTLVFPASPSSAATIGDEVIVDELDSGFQHFQDGDGQWSSIPCGADDCWAGHAFWTYNRSPFNPGDLSQPVDWAFWTPSLPQAGYYFVDAFVPATNATTTGAEYIISHAGQEDTVALDQSQSSGWVRLDAFYFAADGSENVYLSDVVPEQGIAEVQVGFDAVKFVYAGQTRPVVDRIPPVIHWAKRWLDGQGHASIRAYVTDNVAVRDVFLIFNGTRIPMTLVGDGLYEAPVDVPAAKMSTFTIVATDTSGNKATFPRSSQAKVPGYRSTRLGSYNTACSCSKDGSPGTLGAEVDPVITDPETANYADVTVDQTVPGIGDTSIVILRGFNSAPAEPQGEILYTEEGDSVIETPANVHPEPFGRGSSFLLSVLAIDNLVFHGVQLRDEDGSTINFTDNGNGTFTPVEPRVYDILTKSGDGYLLKRKDLNTYRFNSDGQLIEKQDRNNNTISYTWNGAALTLAENSAGRQVHFQSTDEGLITDVYAPEGIHLHYTYTGDLLTSFTDAEGNTWQYQYNDNERLSAILTPKGHPKLQLNYDDIGRVTSQTLGNGRQYTFTYNADTHTTVITDPDGKQTTHLYNDKPELTVSENAVGAEHYGYQKGLRVAFKDRAGRDWQYTFDDRGNILTEDGPLTWHREWQYNGLDLPTSLKDPLGRIWHITYDNRGNPLSVTNPMSGTSTTAYDSRGLATASADFEQHTTTRSYDPTTGDLLTLTNPKSDSMSYTYTGMGWVKTVTDFNGNQYTYTYNKNGDVTAVDGPLNYHVADRYDANRNLTDVTDPTGVVTHIDYNDIEKPITVIENYRPDKPADHETNVTTHYTYSPAGDLISKTDPLGHETTYRYDDAHRLVGEQDVQEHTTAYQLDNVGNALAVIDRNGHRTEQTFDDLDRRTAQVDAEGHREEYTYDLAGNVRFIKNGRGETYEVQYDALNQPVVMIDPLGHKETIAYDQMGNVLKHTDRNGNTENFAYDAWNLLVTHTDAESHTTTFEHDKNGNTTAVIDGNGNRTRSAFNQLDQLESVTNGENQTTRYIRNAIGNVIDQIDAAGIVTHNGYDSLHRLVAVTLNQRPGQPANADTNVTYRYAFDANSNLKAITDPLNHATRFEQDSLDRLIKEIDAGNNTWTYSYDNVGNLLTRLDAKGNLTTYSYYADDHLKRIDYADGTFVSYDQDANHNVIQMLDHLGVTTSVYDELDRPIKVTDALSRTLAYSYDPASRLTNVTYPDGRTTGYDYYRNNWLKSVTDPKGNVTAYERDGVGQTTRTINPNSTIAEMGYDHANRPVSVINRQIGGGDHLISAYTYTLNQVGFKVKAVQDYGWRQPNRVTETYSYDGLWRVTGVQSSDGYQASYQFDAASNRTRWQANDDLGTQTPRDGFTTLYTFDATNRLQKATVASVKPNGNKTYTFQYDANGNRINSEWNGPQGPSVQGTDYTYDMENMLVQALNYQRGGINRVDRTVTRFIHDGNGLRLAKEYDPKDGSDGIKRTEYAFTGLDPVAEYDMWNGQHRNFYRGDEGRITTMQHFRSPDGEGLLYWYHSDGLGSVSGLTKQSGQSTHNYRYDISGSVYPDKGNFTNPHNGYTFTGQELDEETSLIHFAVRDYDPGMGVWLTQDTYRGTLNSPLSLHRYMYTYNNPVNHKDRYGNYAEIYEASDQYTVKATVYIFGEGASDDLANKWEGWINDSWNNNSQYNNKKIVFDINVVNLGKLPEYDDPQKVSTDKDIKNVFKIKKEWGWIDDNPGVIFDPSNPNAQFYGTWYSSMSKGYVIHEVGHVFGLPDDYNNLWSVMGMIWPWTHVTKDNAISVIKSKYYPYNPGVCIANKTQ